jgi:DNA-directed RNA polymerase subunit RPC12/RpoP
MQKQLTALELYNLKTVPEVQPKRKRTQTITEAIPAAQTVTYQCVDCCKFVQLSSNCDIKCHHCECRMVFKIKHQTMKKIQAI